MVLQLMAGVLVAFLFALVSVVFFMYVVLIPENWGLGFVGSLRKSTREILWSFRLRSHQD